MPICPQAQTLKAGEDVRWTLCTWLNNNAYGASPFVQSLQSEYKPVPRWVIANYLPSRERSRRIEASAFGGFRKWFTSCLLWAGTVDKRQVVHGIISCAALVCSRGLESDPRGRHVEHPALESGNGASRGGESSLVSGHTSSGGDTASTCSVERLKLSGTMLDARCFLRDGLCWQFSRDKVFREADKTEEGNDDED